MNHASTPDKDSIPEFLIGGGELGKMIREYDWSSTSIGPIHTWPKSLQTCIRIMLTSRQPIWIGWGKDLIKFYNDPYKAIVGGKHPWALGQPASIVWKDIWKDIAPMLKTVMEEDEGTYAESQLLIMERNGYPEETYYTFSYTPIPGDEGGTEGMICANTEDTDRIISQRQLETLSSLGKVLTDVHEQDIYANTIECLKGNAFDFPFALLYQLNGNAVRLAGSTVPKKDRTKLPATLDIQSSEEIAKRLTRSAITRDIEVISDVRNVLGEMPTGAWQKMAENAIILPIGPSAQKDPYGFLIVGMNPFRLLDEKYKNFFELLADQISTSITNIRTIDAERKRLEAMAEIDKAKTTFFSNISHEFRTPLTLLLGPIQDALNEPEAINENKDRMDVALRNALRMQKLVNMLLDFSRIEAGKMDAVFSAVNITTLTEDLVSTFRSAIQKAGMTLIVNMEKINDPVVVDVDMWEKIVLNLLSNAFKYSNEGSITVTLKQKNGEVVLAVKDTGTGIPLDEQAKIFERFHRVQNVKGRSQEGTGIGLAMVKELVKIHKGSITVQSNPGDGSTFTVIIPFGNTNDLVKTVSDIAGNTPKISSTFVNEASRWGGKTTSDDNTKTTTHNKTPFTEKKLTVLLADDNIDMQQYIQRLLSSEYNVLTAANGVEALAKVVSDKPDLVISDIMMPEMDGMELLSRIRGNERIRNTPVIFLSARAGEESRVEGLDAGADDYLVKPFSSRELLAKVSSQIRLTQARLKNETQLRSLFNLAPVGITILRKPDYVVEMANSFYLAMVDKDESFIGKPLFESLPELNNQGLLDLMTEVTTTGQPYVGIERPVQLKTKGKLDTFYFNFVYHPAAEADGSITGIIVIANDVTNLVLSRNAARENAIELERKINERTAELKTQRDFVEAIMDSSMDLMLVFDKQHHILAINKKVEEVYSIRKESTIGRPVKELFPALSDTDYASIDKALSGELVHNKSYRSGKVNRHFESYLIPLRTSTGEVYAVLSTAHDITDIIDASMQIRTTAAQLEEANQSLMKQNYELEQFAYVSSHDLQEPLRKIQTFASLLRENVEKPEHIYKYLDKIDSSASRMTTLIRDVLQYSRLSAEAQKKETIDLNEILNNVTLDFELLISQKNASIVSDLPFSIKGNKLQFHQLFSNLVGNALKFSDKPPVIIVNAAHVAGREVPSNGTILPDAKFIRLSFKDNGIGFESEYAEQIFGLFNRLHNRQDYSGTGIGLALCKKIVENHNGFIKATSVIGTGATFDIYLPDTSIPV